MGAKLKVTGTARWLIALLPLSTPALAGQADDAAKARAQVEATVGSAALAVAIEQRPVACRRPTDLCYSAAYPRLFWYRDASPRHMCRTVMSPRKRPKVSLTDEGEVPFAPAAVFARSAAPQDAWIDWRGVTRVEAQGKQVIVTAPLNAYRVSFAFGTPKRAGEAAAAFERLRSACDDGSGPVVDLLQAYRVALKTLQQDRVSAAFTLSEKSEPDDAAYTWPDARIDSYNGGMCAGGSLYGTSAGKGFVTSVPQLRFSAVTRSDSTVMITQTDSAGRRGIRLALGMGGPASAQRLADALGFIRAWCVSDYDESRIYSRVF